MVEDMIDKATQAPQRAKSARDDVVKSDPYRSARGAREEECLKCWPPSAGSGGLRRIATMLKRMRTFERDRRPGGQHCPAAKAYGNIRLSPPRPAAGWWCWRRKWCGGRWTRSSTHTARPAGSSRWTTPSTAITATSSTARSHREDPAGVCFRLHCFSATRHIDGSPITPQTSPKTIYLVRETCPAQTRPGSRDQPDIFPAYAQGKVLVVEDDRRCGCPHLRLKLADTVIVATDGGRYLAGAQLKQPDIVLSLDAAGSGRPGCRRRLRSGPTRGTC